jgi:MFS family permease
MVFSMLAVYAQTLGAPPSMIGVMMACFGGARLAVSLPAGIASERFGRRAVMLGGLVVLTLGSFAAAATADINLLLVCLLAQGAGTSAFVTAALAAVADLGTPESRTGDMAAYQGAQLGGISIGPALGGLVVAYGGFTAVFLLQGAIVMLALALLAHDSAIGSAQTSPSPVRARTRASFPAGTIGLASVSYGVFFARVAANWVLMPMFARDNLGMSVAAIGLLLTLGAVANFAVLPLAAGLSRRLGHRALVVVANLATIAALILLANVHWEPVLWLTGVMLGATSALAAPALSAMTADAAPPGQLGAAMGMMRTLNDLGVISGPILTGIVVGRLGFGYAGGLLAAALVLAVATIIFALTKHLAPAHRAPP